MQPPCNPNAPLAATSSMSTPRSCAMAPRTEKMAVAAMSEVTKSSEDTMKASMCTWNGNGNTVGQL